MSGPEVRVGDIVLWRVPSEVEEEMRERFLVEEKRLRGNIPYAGTEVAMLVTAVWGERQINGIAFLDGNATKWITSTTDWRRK